MKGKAKMARTKKIRIPGTELETPLTIMMPSQFKRRFQDQCDKEYKSLSTVVREIISTWMNTHEKLETRKEN
jgi:predicted DNA-binding protein